VFTAAGGLVREFFAYDGGFRGGVRVAAGDVNDDGLADIITGAGPAADARPRLQRQRRQGVLTEFFAYDGRLPRRRLRRRGDVNGDGHADMSPGPAARRTSKSSTA